MKKGFLHGIGRRGLVVLVTALFGFSSLPAVTYGQMPVTDSAAVTQRESLFGREEVKKALYGGTVGAVTTSLINLMTHFANNLAYNAAVWVASGGNSETPLFDGRPAADYFIYVGNSIAAEVVNQLVEDKVIDGAFKEFSVCAPPELPALRLGIKSAFQPEELEICGVNELKNNWQGFIASVETTLTDPEERTRVVLETISQSFDHRVNEFSVSLGLYSDTLLAAESKGRFDLMEHLRDNGFRGVVDFVTGQVKTPASMVWNVYEETSHQASALPRDIALNLLANSDALVQVGVSAGSVFTNTLLSEMTKKLSEGLFDPIEFADPFSEFGSSGSDRASAQDQFRSFTSFTPLKVTNFNLLQEFSTCPSFVRGTSRRLYNCVMDSSFASAVTRADAGAPLTVKEAVDQGLLRGNWPLIPSSDEARDGDTNCYTYGFCHSNLVKLRKARIIPIGWELAANSNANTSGDTTLREVMDGFNDCNEDGERDDNHPWCHLIDPNWVLKYPDSQCRTMAYGQILEAAGTDARAQECVDITSCIDHDENGNCIGGYGYCVQEKNVWDFRGDACPAQYASCLTFDNPNGGSVSYLTTSVNQSGCDESNAGCYWYSTEKTETADGFDWPVITDVAVADASPTAYEERIYFTNAVEECDAVDGGCTELYERTEDLRLNLIQNPGFEKISAQGFPTFWQADNFGGMTFSSDSSQDRSGSGAINPGSADVKQYGLVLSQSSFYTLSFYAKQPAVGVSNQVDVVLEFVDEDGVQTPNLTGTSFTNGCSTSYGTDSIAILATPTGAEYQRFDCTFTSPTLADRSSRIIATVNIFGPGAGATDVWVDDIQLEQAEDVSVFHEHYSDSSALRATYLKLPPQYLGCTGSDSDPEECADYAQICSEADAGCSLYTPDNGDPAVSGIASSLDMCDDVCVGYDTYKQEPTPYEPTGDFPVYFIPDTAESCSEHAVGCEEFTNLATEEKEYFTYIRSCVTTEQASRNSNGDQEAVFYTWEGSDTEGYQLRTWNLLESNLSTGNYTFASGFREVNLGAAPCTEWVTDENGIHCTDDIAEITANAACDEHDDIFTNPDCREFYDAEGNIHYREWMQTVTVNDVCTSYRKTDVVGLGRDTDANGLDDGGENCSESGGYFNTATSACIYYGHAEESVECSESENGCRKYTGGQSRNSRVAFEDLFESGTVSNWDSASAAGVTYSNDSIATGGHSLLSEGQTVWTHFFNNSAECTAAEGCAAPAGALGGSCVVIQGERYCGLLHNELFAGKTYTLTFWAKGIGSLDVGFDTQASSGSVGIDIPFAEDIELSTGWERYSFGPIDANALDYPNFGVGTVLTFAPQNGSTSFYIDNVVLREGESDVTVIKDSWVTPAVCDQNQLGQVSPQFQLGCQEYTNQNSETVYLKSFSRLCDEGKVGCTAYFASAQTEAPHAEVYNAVCENLDLNGNGLPDTATATVACHVYQNSALNGFDTSSEKLCDILPGQRSCRFDADQFLPEVTRSAEPRLAHVVYSSDTAIVDADYAVYAVYNEEFTCGSGAAGCTEVGRPTFSSDRSIVESWETQYLMNDPDTYAKTLCQGDELFCEEWNAGAEGVWYFKDPQAQACEYKTDVTIGGVTYNGWFRTGTTEFCYGSGTCSGNGTTACTLDSECAVLGLGTCTVTTGSYMIGGNSSGLWRNGDAGYGGWVGVCGQEYDNCSEFQDPMVLGDNEFYGQTDGESHYYIDNSALNENTGTAAQKCNGDVSQKEGCVLFNDTGTLGLKYNASASYIASNHADEIYGTKKFNLVDPIDCSNGGEVITMPNGDQINLCAQRCVYRANLLDTNANIPQTSLDFFEFGGSCFTDADCGTYESNTGDKVMGECTGSVDIISGGTPTATNVPILENDTNRVLRVNRDRECSEWLACASERTVWDESIGGYRTICEGIDLCTAYGGEGSAANCVEWDTDDVAVVLDESKYSSRDVTWYGEEYSGYSVPNIYPIQFLSQVDIAPPANTCSFDPVLYGGNAAAARAFGGDACSIYSDCGGYALEGACNPNVDDYRLVYNAGTCDVGYGESCDVGYCSVSGNPCSDTAQCGATGGSCIVGSCIDGAGEVTGDCGLDFACGAGSTCVTSKAFKTGSCYNGSCVVSKEGQPFNTETAETAVCRAHPEANAPFGNELVKLWGEITDGATSDYVSTTSNPSDIIGTSVFNAVSGYEEANFCAPGEDCVCTYAKVNSAAGNPVYIETGATIDFNGVCSGGLTPGAACNVDNDCGDGGTCHDINRVDTLFGLEGFCLERDTGLNIHGDPDLGACLTWLPVDQLAGSTDLYAKFVGAGYDLGRTDYCAYVAPYYDIAASKAVAPTNGDWKTATIACAENTSTGEDWERCVLNNEDFACPPGQYAIVGPRHGGSEYDASFSKTCSLGGFGNDDDCPFVCVPMEGYYKGDDTHEDGEVCPLPGDFAGVTKQGTKQGKDLIRSDGTEGKIPTDWYYISNPQLFTDAALEVQNCWAMGLEINMDMTGDGQGRFSFGLSDEFDKNNANGWYGYSQAYDIYLGCQETVIADDGKFIDAAPYTDRLLREGSYTLDSVFPELEYTSKVGRVPFGAAMTPDEIEKGGPDYYPAVIGQCRSSSVFPEITLPANSSVFDTCSKGNPYKDLVNPNARSFYDLYFNVDKREVTRGNDYFYVTYEWNVDAAVMLNKIASYPMLVAQLFAKSLGWTVFDDGMDADGDIQNAGSVSDNVFSGPHHYEWDERQKNGVPPTLWGLDVDNCYGSYCQQGERNVLTLNNQNLGNINATNGYFKAILNFYAAAYKEQLPLRRIIVDWQDGTAPTGSSSDDNFYKNFRGLKDGSQTAQWCDDGSEWGLTSESCEPNFLSYNHSYTCSQHDIDTLPACSTDANGKLLNSPCSTGTACGFQPRVHVRDNWGWCTGTCNSTDTTINRDGTPGCFAAYGNIDVPHIKDECNYLEFPGSTNSDTNPWVYYDGIIYITP